MRTTSAGAEDARGRGERYFADGEIVQLGFKFNYYSRYECYGIGLSAIQRMKITFGGVFRLVNQQ